MRVAVVVIAFDEPDEAWAEHGVGGCEEGGAEGFDTGEGGGDSFFEGGGDGGGGGGEGGEEGVVVPGHGGVVEEGSVGGGAGVFD